MLLKIEDNYQRGDEVGIYLKKVIKETEVSDPAFGGALRKWRPLLSKTVRHVAAITKIEPLDVLGDFMVVLVCLNAGYGIPLYRFEGGVYEMMEEDASGALLRSPRYNVRQVEPFRVAKELIIPVKKAKLSCLMSSKIRHHSCIMLRDFFVQKRGYSVIGVEAASNGPPGARLLKKKLYKAEEVSLQETIRQAGSVLEVGEVVSQDDLLLRHPRMDSPEEMAQYASLQRAVREGLSWPARAVFEVVCENSSLTPTGVIQVLGLEMRQVRYAQREIALQTEKVLDLKDISGYTRPDCINPIHLRSDLICV